MRGFTLFMGLIIVVGGLVMFAFFPQYMPRLNLNQEGLHALSHKARQEIKDGTMAEKIVKQEGSKRAAAMRAGLQGKPLPSGGQQKSSVRFKRAPGTEPKE